MGSGTILRFIVADPFNILNLTISNNKKMKSKIIRAFLLYISITLILLLLIPQLYGQESKAFMQFKENINSTNYNQLLKRIDEVNMDISQKGLVYDSVFNILCVANTR